MDQAAGYVQGQLYK
jgi:hypothetical protein